MKLLKLKQQKREAGSGEEDATRKRIPRLRVKRKHIFIVVVLLLVFGAAGVGAKALFFTQEEQTALTEQTTYGSLATTIEGTGVTLPADSVTVTTASTAKIEKVYVSAGDTVAVGDLLYVQDDAELDDQIEEYQDQISDLQDELNSAEDQLTDLRETMEELQITAPFSGRMTEIEGEEGDEIMSGQTLAVLVDDTKMTLTQYFSYTYENEVSLGMEAGVSVASLMNHFSGKVTDIEKVDRVTTEGTRCFAVTVTLENPGALTEGMTGAGYLLAASGEKIYPAIEGELKYNNQKTITAQAGGTLSTVKPVDYQKVNAGDTLFIIDDESYQSQLETLEKKQTQTQTRITSYTEKIAEAEEKRAEYAVTSEIAGKVIMVMVKEGEKPRQVGQTAVSIYNLDSMTISANIDELDIGSVSKDMTVDITSSGAEKDIHYEGTITEISYEATNSNGVAYFPVTIEIPSQGALSAGVNVSYTIKVGDTEEGVLAPVSALKNTSEGACLFVKAETRPEHAVDLEDVEVPVGFYAVPVETGVSNSRYVRILSGVEQDVEVFTRYQQAAPSGGGSTSQNQESETQPSGMQGSGTRPDFGGMQGGMQGMPPGMN